MPSLFEFGSDRYQPDESFLNESRDNFQFNQRKLAFAVGLIAFGLPLVLLLGVAAGTCFRESISHFYYAQFLGSAFIGLLIAIAVILFVYTGENKKEQCLATLAGIGALIVAMFPTKDSGCSESTLTARIFADLKLHAMPNEYIVVTKPDAQETHFQLFALASGFHVAGAVAVFAILAVFCFWVFTRTTEQHRDTEGKLKSGKIRRNTLYKVSGTVILVSMLAVLTGFVGQTHYPAAFAFWNEFRLTFWFESLMLWAFAISWMVKGQFWKYGFLTGFPYHKHLKDD